LATYVFVYDSGGGTTWERDFGLPSAEAAQAEGALLLENQAVLTRLTGQTLSVFRAEGSMRALVGTWIWSEAGSEWRPAASETAFGERDIFSHGSLTA